MWVNVLLKALLFIVFAPGVHFHIPGTLVEKALVGGLLFSVANWIVYKHVRPMLERFENPSTKIDQPCPPGSVKCPSGDCKVKGDVHSPCS